MRSYIGTAMQDAQQDMTQEARQSAYEYVSKTGVIIPPHPKPET